MTGMWRLLIGSALLLSIAGCANRPAQDASTSAPPNVPSETVQAHDEPVAALGLLTSRQPWQFADIEGHLIITPNYRLYTTVESDDFLERLPRFYEQALEHYTTALAKLPKPDVPLETYLFMTRGQWQLKTQEMLPDQSKMFANLGRGGFTTKGTSVLYYIDRRGFPRDTFAIAAHEGWHQYTQRTFKHQLPIWLEEGVATYMEGYRINRDGEGEPQFMPTANYERRESLRDAVRKSELISLNDLLIRTPQSFLTESKDALLIYYAQVWALTRFLSEGEGGRYKPALSQVLIDAAQGRLVGRMMTSNPSSNTRRRGQILSSKIGPAVAQEYFNHDLGALESQYLAFVDQIIRQEGRRGR